jgi:hypothetical protein
MAPPTTPPTTSARKTFVAFRESTGQIADADLDAFWETLSPATIELMIGEWKGGEFVTGHRANGFMARLNWFGKTFHSDMDAEPLVCLDADGNKFSNVEAMKGAASLWLEEFRGEVTATMVYDGMAVLDHFKRVDDDTLMGVMNGKPALVLPTGHHFYFGLERESAREAV